MKLFNDSDMFDKKIYKATFFEKKDTSEEGQDKIVEKVVSKDQVNFKSGTSDQAIAKDFHVVLNLRISTALVNADFIVTDDQVKNALIKVCRNDKEQKILSSNLWRHIDKTEP